MGLYHSQQEAILSNGAMKRELLFPNTLKKGKIMKSGKKFGQMKVGHIDGYVIFRRTKNGGSRQVRLFDGTFISSRLFNSQEIVQMEVEFGKKYPIRMQIEAYSTWLV